MNKGWMLVKPKFQESYETQEDYLRSLEIITLKLNLLTQMK